MTSEKYQHRRWERKEYCGYWFDTPDGSIWLPSDSRPLPEFLEWEKAPDMMLFDFADNIWHITFAGAVELAVGLLGLRASNDASKIMPVWVLSLISLVGQVVGFIMGIVQGTAMNGLLSSLVSLALAGLMFWAANNVKAEAGK
jgi:hypothetical protein